MDAAIVLIAHPVGRCNTHVVRTFVIVQTVYDYSKSKAAVFTSQSKCSLMAELGNEAQTSIVRDGSSSDVSGPKSNVRFVIPLRASQVLRLHGGIWPIADIVKFVRCLARFDLTSGILLSLLSLLSSVFQTCRL
jgi:hypothetical protein